MIAICFLTYGDPPERQEYAEATLRSLHLLHAEEDVWLHLADDGTPDQGYRDRLLAIARETFGERTSVSNSEHRGYGGNYNLAMQTTHNLADIILPLEDDWRVVREFDLTPVVEVLRRQVFRCVRMGYIGFTDRLQAHFVSAGNLYWLELDPDSPERHVFTGGPRLEHVDFERELGLWPEQMDQGTTEQAVCDRPQARQGVAWPIHFIHPSGDLFAHIGSMKADTGHAVVAAGVAG